MARILQYHSSIATLDAIGNSIGMLHEALTRRGVESYMLCQDDQLHASRPGVRGASSLLGISVAEGLREDDLLILHYSFLDATALQLALLPIKKMFVYHNVTPGHFFRRQPGMEWLGDLCDAARGELGRYAGLFDMAVGDSDYNGDELRSVGFNNIRTIPVFVGTDFFREEVRADDLMRLRSAASTNLLFVGRFVPNKNVEALIATLAEYRKAFDPTAVLHLVGKIWNDAYFAQLVALAAELGVAGGLRFHFHLDPEGLKALFAAADAFVCLSEHEGFMVPVVEAFAAGCPVVAYGAAAVSETMGDGGFCLDEPDPVQAAGLVHLLKTDRPLRERVIADGARRAFDFRREATEARWMEAIGGLVPLNASVGAGRA